MEADTPTKKRKLEDEEGNGEEPKIRRVTAEYNHSDYTVGWVCALPKEQTAATSMLDKEHPSLTNPRNDPNAYTLGSVGEHNVVIACLPKGQIGTVSAATVATRMIQTFPSIKFGLMVGIGGGVPRRGSDVRLGDVVVSSPTGQFGGVVQWDLGKAKEGGKFQRTGSLNSPPASLLSALTKIESLHERSEPKIQSLLDEMGRKWPKLASTYLRSEKLVDVLFKADCSHVDKPADVDSDDDDDDDEEDASECRFCDKTKIKSRKPPSRGMKVHYGLIASGDQVIKDAAFRNKLNKDLGGDLLCIEMEAAGLMTNFPCLVIRGICDYADSHKNKVWQEHAAAVAAAFAKELLVYHVQPEEVKGERTAREQLAEQLKTIDENVKQVHIKMTTAEDKDALDWLTLINYGSNQSYHFKTSHKGTGKWFLDSTEYSSWQESAGKTLYCPGIPGAGKTILTSIVINDIVSKFGGDENIGIAYVYCSFERTSEQGLENLLSSLLKQLAQGHAGLPQSVRNLVKKHKDRGTRPSSDELSEALRSLSKTFSKVFILVDALDECQAIGCRSSLLTILSEQRTKDDSPVHLFATSRFIPKIEERFEGALRCEIRAAEEDVRRYVGHQLPDFQVQIARIPDLEKKIIDGVTKAVGGMFLLARLYLGALTNTTSVREILTALEKFKQQGIARSESQEKSEQAYDEAYDETMGRIDGQASNLRDLGRKVIVWVVHAIRPMTTVELNHALAVNVQDASFDRDNLRDVEILISVCAGLVTVDRTSDTIRLVHYTTQEYFERRREQYFPGGHMKMASICVKYLRFVLEGNLNLATFFKHDTKRQKGGLYPFFLHAVHGWAYHTAQSSCLNQDVLDFLLDDAKIQALSTFVVSNEFPNSGLGWAAYHGIIEAIDFFHSNGHDVDAPDSSGKTPLFYAAQAGRIDTVKHLCELGASATHIYQEPTPPGDAGFESSRPPEALLGNSTSVGWENDDTKTSTTLETRTEVSNASKTFSRKEMSTSSRRNMEKTSLVVAMFHEYPEIIKLLLDKGASVDARGQHGRTSLAVAAELDDLSLVDLLLDNGAFIDAIDDFACTPLLIATERGSKLSARRLVEKEARLDLVDEYGCTALAYAARLGDVGLVTMILDRGATIDVATGKGTTPLSFAAEGGHAEVVKLLIARGANLDVQDYVKTTALHYSCREGYSEIVGLLVDAGANLEAEDNEGKTPLSSAAERGRFDAVKVLLENGANVQTTDRHHRAPLSWTCRSSGREAPRYVKTIRLMIEKGADIKAQDKYGRTALSFAASGQGTDEAVRLLIDLGADLDVLDQWGRTALTMARRWNRDEAARMLIEAGSRTDDSYIKGLD